MITKIEENDGIMTVYLEGRLDTSTSSETEIALKPVYETECKEIVIDCSRLEYIASSGLRLFLSLRIETQPQDKHICVKGLNKELSDVFDMTGFSDLFDFI
jgi:anti-sigma B factor antagonist